MREAYVMSTAMFQELQRQCADDGLDGMSGTSAFVGVPIHVYRSQEEKVRICETLRRCNVLVRLCVDERDELEGTADECAADEALVRHLCDRIDELEKALRQYADRNNWGVVVYTDDIVHVRWIGPGDSGPDVARKALEGERER